MTYLVKSSDILQVTLKGTFDTLYQKVYFQLTDLIYILLKFLKEMHANQLARMSSLISPQSMGPGQIIVYDVIVFRYMQ